MPVNGATGEAEDTMSPGYVERHAARQIKPSVYALDPPIGRKQHWRCSVRRLGELVADAHGKSADEVERRAQLIAELLRRVEG